jgi:hypothetical protein
VVVDDQHPRRHRAIVAPATSGAALNPAIVQGSP